MPVPSEDAYDLEPHEPEWRIEADEDPLDALWRKRSHPVDPLATISEHG
jgi:hypothetical protein